MITGEIRKELKKLQDKGYREMQVTIIPTLEADSIIGVRTPALRQLAKELAKREDISEFLSDLPHKFFEENQLHAFILSGMKDAESCIRLVDEFLPYVDNWAVCDTISPKLFQKYPEEVYQKIKVWVKSDHPYTVRFGVVSLLQFFLDEEFRPDMLRLVADIHREEYYIKMAIAWYFSFALIKQYESTIPMVESMTLEPWIQNKTIQKAVESYRIGDERKNYLRTLKVKR